MPTGSDADRYELVRPSEEVLAVLGLPPMTFPVRAERINDVFPDGAVHLDRLVDELEILLSEHPEVRARYEDATALLCYVVGVAKAHENDNAAALHYLDLGLSLRPDNLSLRSHLGLVLMALGQWEEAASEFRALLADECIGTAPVLAVLAARLEEALGDPAKAYETLRGLARHLPDDDAFWELLSHMRDAAGLPGPADATS